MVNNSKKLGIAVINSAEANVLSIGERFLKCAWSWYFMLVKGNDSKEDILH